MLNLSTKATLGLIAVVMSGVSISSVTIAYSLASNYHCDDPIWLSKSEWKNGAHPAMAPDIHLDSITSCKAVVGNIYGGAFFLGIMMPWVIFSINVMIWKGGLKEDEYDQSKDSERLCQLHLNQKIASYLWDEKFTLHYKSNLGKCDLCNQDALGLFIKKSSNDSIVQPSGEKE